ncbi:MAG: hypothetical protein FWH55_02600 [Oscillospiraceae bacterium]|nr:hypothetical protein [Oscillospiraceae bacterium]
MRTVYGNYIELYDKYGEEIYNWCIILKEQAFAFYNKNIDGVSISDIAYEPNEILIEEVVLNTIDDLNRIKNYHDVSKPSMQKYAAYIGFWWQRVKPLSPKVQNLKDSMLYKGNELDRFKITLCESLNETFITDLLFSYININHEHSEVYCSEWEKKDKYQDLKGSLRYFLKYRHYSAQDLELFLKGADVCPLIIS